MYWFYNDVFFYLLCLWPVYMISGRNNILILNLNKISDGKVNLVVAFGKSKLKIPSSFHKYREKQKNQ